MLACIGSTLGFGCLKGVSSAKSVQVLFHGLEAVVVTVLFNGIEAVVVMTLIILK